MTYDAVKNRLHDYIEHADKEKILAIYTLLYSEANDDLYGEAVLKSLETTRDDMYSDKEKTYTLEQTIENIRQHRQHGI